MKKVFLVLSAVAMLACVSCKKECTCTTKVDGEKTTEAKISKGDKKCSDLNTEVSMAGHTTKTTCR